MAIVSCNKQTLTLPELRSPVGSLFVAHDARKYKTVLRSRGIVLRPRSGLHWGPKTLPS